MADATVRLGNYFYRNKKFRTAGRIFYKFAIRAPHHRLAVKALFLGGQCHMRKQDYKESVRLLKMVLAIYPDAHKVRAEAMYWLAESYCQLRNHVKAYQTFKKLTWDYPQTKSAEAAREQLKTLAPGGS